MKKIIYIALLFMFLSPSAFAGVNASAAIMRVYEAYLSPNSDCSSAVPFFDAQRDSDHYPNGYSEIDMALNPTIGSGHMNVGTFRCLIFKISDEITFIPAADDGDECTAGSTYTTDICNDPNMIIQNADTGAQTTCSAIYGTDDIVWIYFSIYSTSSSSSACTDCNAFVPPTSDGDAKHGLKLDNEIVLTSNITATLVFGTNGKVLTDSPDGGATFRCDMEPADISIRVTP